MVKNPPTNAGDTRDAGDIRDEVLSPGSRRSPGGGHGNPLQYSCLENPADREPGGLQSRGSQESNSTWQLKRHHQEPLEDDAYMSRKPNVSRFAFSDILS